MKKILTISLALVLLGGCSAYNGTQNTSPGTSPTSVANPVSPVAANTINIQNFSFNPAMLTVKKGTSVTWTNNDSAPHQIKSATFNSPELSNGQSFVFTFNEAGTFDYSCAIHPSMTGTIIVE